MADQEERRRPYAAASNVVGALQRARTRNLPDKIDDDFLRIVGIPDIVFGRVIEALRFLGMTEENGEPSDTFKAIGAATDEEYRSILEGVVREAYREDFARIDPGQDPQARIVDAFKPYQPRSQTNRMVMLFLGLCREAGIPVLDAPRQRQMKSGAATKHSFVRRNNNPQSNKPAGGGGSGASPRASVPSGQLFGVTEEDIAALPQEEFDEVWAALGKVARARARRTTQPEPATGFEGQPPASKTEDPQ
jgi:hypothetical protein